jgi:hypothetical protein
VSVSDQGTPALCVAIDQAFTGQSDTSGVRHPLKDTRTGFPNLLNRAAKKEGTVVIRVALQDGHDEHKPLEVF